MSNDYASAVVDFLDRESDKISTAVMYPITRIELNDFTGNGLVTTRVFIAKDGKWVEQQ